MTCAFITTTQTSLPPPKKKQKQKKHTHTHAHAHAHSRIHLQKVFTIDMRNDASKPAGSDRNGAGTFHNVLFEDIFIANVSTVRKSLFSGGCVPACGNGPLPTGVPNTLSGGNQTTQNISGVAFNRVTVAGTPLGKALSAHPGLFNMSGSVFNVTVDGVPLSTLTA